MTAESEDALVRDRRTGAAGVRLADPSRESRRLVVDLNDGAATGLRKE